MLAEIQPTPVEALAAVTSGSGRGVYASADTLYKGAVFGRDSLEVAEDVMHSHPELTGRILLTLSGLQGTQSSDRNEEEAGKIVHEFRSPTVDGQPLDETSHQIYEDLMTKWGASSDYLAYYGSSDATPHFIRVVGKYCQLHGRDILSQTTTSLQGETVSVLQAVEQATKWLQAKLEASSSGFIEYKRRNEKGIENQVWKDSKEFYVHPDGQIVDHSQPVASIEVQGLAYDALLAAAELIPGQAPTLLEQAEALRTRIFDRLWLASEAYFALGTDHAPDGSLRIIETRTANPAALLDTALFDGLTETDYQKYVGSIVRTIMGNDFLTDAGIRSRALSQANVVPYWDYHGSYVTWPKETYDIAKGLRRQGFIGCAEQLENRIWNVVCQAGYAEFFFVDGFGRVLLGQQATREHTDTIIVDSSNKPEHIQAWTVSAIIDIERRRQYQTLGTLGAFQQELEQEVLDRVPSIAIMTAGDELNARYPHHSYIVRTNRVNSDWAVHQAVRDIS